MDAQRSASNLLPPRFECVIADGMRYVGATEGRFDVIIVDSNEGGVLVTQNGVPMFQPCELASSIGKFRQLFADAT
jgi:spermidine synthase